MKAAMDIPILYQDDAIVVAVKPPGLLAVPGRGPDKEDCLVSRLRVLFPHMIAQPAVHRLDMATSGLMVFAITATAHRELSRQFAGRTVAKEYIAVLDGLVAAKAGRIELAFRLDPTNRPRQIYDPERGKLGITRWRRLGDEQGLSQGRSRLALFPETGRTHQLRLHTAHPLGLGIPIVGDILYGHGRDGNRLLLHATSLAFVHPVSGKRLVFRSEPDF